MRNKDLVRKIAGHLCSYRVPLLGSLVVPDVIRSSAAANDVSPVWRPICQVRGFTRAQRSTFNVQYSALTTIHDSFAQSFATVNSVSYIVLNTTPSIHRRSDMPAVFSRLLPVVTSAYALQAGKQLTSHIPIELSYFSFQLALCTLCLKPMKSTTISQERWGSCPRPLYPYITLLCERSSGTRFPVQCYPGLAALLRDSCL